MSNGWIGVIFGFCMLTYMGGFVAVGVATDNRIGCKRSACEWRWQVPAAIFWPLWIPAAAVYKIVR